MLGRNILTVSASHADELYDDAFLVTGDWDLGDRFAIQGEHVVAQHAFESVRKIAGTVELQTVRSKRTNSFHILRSSWSVSRLRT